MTEQERAAALADEIERHGYSAGEHEGFDLPINIGEDVIAFLRLLAATPAASSEVRERVAREIYAAFPFDEATGSKPAWVKGGNSIRQDDARRCATRILDLALSAIRPGDRLPAGVVVPEEPSDAQITAMDQILDEMRETDDGWPVSDVVTLYKAAIAAAKETTP